MNKYFLLFCLSLFLMDISFAQKKPIPKDKLPTQKEMQALLKEAQNALDEISPKD